MKFCNRCNNTYIDEFQYCPMCGSVLEKYEFREEREEKKNFEGAPSDLY